MEHTKELFGKRIREIRNARGLTQELFAEMADIDQKHVNRIELGQICPTINSLVKMAAALNVPLKFILDFRHLENDDELAVNVEEMFKELDEDLRKLAYKLIRNVIKTLQEA